MIVNEVLMKVDPKCSVVISDLGEEECIPVHPIVLMPTPIPTISMEVTNDVNEPTVSEQDDQPKTSTLTTTIGVIVVVVVLIIAIATTIIIVIIAVLVLRNRRADYALKNTSSTYVMLLRTVKHLSYSLHFYALILFCSYSYTGMVQKRREEMLSRPPAMRPMKIRSKQGEAYEMMDITPTVTTPTPAAPADQEGMYEIPSASSQPLPAIPPEEAKEKEEEDGVYETIPGDK